MKNLFSKSKISLFILLCVSIGMFSGVAIANAQSDVQVNSSISKNSNPFYEKDLKWKNEVKSSIGEATAASELPKTKNSVTINSVGDTSPKYIIEFKKTATLGEIYDCVKNLNYSILGTSDDRIFTIQTDDIKGFKKKYSDIIKLCEADGTMNVSDVDVIAPNDTEFIKQWAIPDINLQGAWSISKGSDSVKVAVIDTGFNRTCQDFVSENILQGSDITGNRGAVNADLNGHGTATTSIIASANNNAFGMAGVCWNVKIVPYKVNYGSENQLSTSAIVAALHMAADAGCDVINMSFGSEIDYLSISNALEYAKSKGCILVAAAGNDGNSTPNYPASNPGVISVGAVNSNNEKAYFSQYNYGIAVVAPGQTILVNAPNGTADRFVYLDGTSFSSPYVAGVAALVKSVDQSITSFDFLNMLAATSTDFGTPGYDKYFGWGLINAQKMLQLANGSLVISNPPLVADKVAGVNFNTLTNTVTNELGTQSNVIIPSTINGVTVKKILPYAFNGSEILKSITIPTTITAIASVQFAGCPSLMSVTLPDSITSIGDGAFRNCPSLQNIVLPNSVTSVGAYVFSECSSLKTVTLPNSITTITRDMFSYCKALENISLPNSITSIGNGAFSNCEQLSSMVIPNNVISIEFSAFSDCLALSSVTIPNGVKNIGPYAFMRCSSLKSVIIPGSVTSMGVQVFAGCSGLKYVRIENGSTSMSNNEFLMCSSLISVIIPDSITNFDGTEFTNCPKLIRIVGTIGSSAHTFAIKNNIPFCDISENFCVKFENEDHSILEVQTTNPLNGVRAPIDPIREGYTFAGWYNGDQLFDFSSIVFSDLTLTAHWTENNYTITYSAEDKTDGSVPIDSQNYHITNQAVVLGNTGNLTKIGYTFKGWNTKQDGTGTEYLEGDKLTIGNENITLYAQWTLDNYAITYSATDKTEGSVPIDSQNYHITNQAVVLGNNGDFKKTGYTFKGWNTKQDGSGTAYLAGDIVTFESGSITLYAQWGINTYTVTFNSNGGSAVRSKAANYYMAIAAPTAPIKTGYTFAGWFKNSTLTTAWNFTTDRLLTNTILYAKWNAATPAMPTSVYAVSSNYNTVTIRWARSANASNYKVYRSTSIRGTYSLVAATTSLFYVNTGLITGKTYYYKVVAVFSPTGKASSYSAVASVRVIPGKAEIVAVTKVASRSIKVGYTPVTGATGYEVYYSTSRTGTYLRAISTKATSYTKTGLTRGKTYFFKVRAYRTVNGTRIYGVFSEIKSLKL